MTDPRTDKRENAESATENAPGTNVARHGVPGFHPTQDEEGRPLARQEPDADQGARADTGTGDQPGNTGGDRFATPSGDAATDRL